MRQSVFYKPSISLENHLLYGNVHVSLCNGQIKPLVNGQIVLFAHNEHLAQTFTDNNGYYHLLFSIPTTLDVNHYAITSNNHLSPIFSIHVSQEETMKDYTSMQIYNYTIETLQNYTSSGQIVHSPQYIWKMMIVMHETITNNPIPASGYHGIWIYSSILGILGWFILYYLRKTIYKSIQTVNSQEIKHKRIYPIWCNETQNEAYYQLEHKIYKSGHLKCVLMDDYIEK